MHETERAIRVGVDELRDWMLDLPASEVVRLATDGVHVKVANGRSDIALADVDLRTFTRDAQWNASGPHHAAEAGLRELTEGARGEIEFRFRIGEVPAETGRDIVFDTSLHNHGSAESRRAVTARFVTTDHVAGDGTVYEMAGRRASDALLVAVSNARGNPFLIARIGVGDHVVHKVPDGLRTRLGRRVRGLILSELVPRHEGLGLGEAVADAVALTRAAQTPVV